MSAKSGFSEEAISDAQETFMLFDTKGDGMIPCNQVNNRYIFSRVVKVVVIVWIRLIELLEDGKIFLCFR